MSLRSRKLNRRLFDLKIDNSSYFSFHLAKTEIRLENDGQIFFNYGKYRIPCGDGPLVYGERSGNINDMIRTLQNVLLSSPIKAELVNNVGQYYYNHPDDHIVFGEFINYAITDGSNSIFWLYRVDEKNFFFEFTMGSRFNTPETPFHKLHSGTLTEDEVKKLIDELECSKGHFNTDIF